MKHITVILTAVLATQLALALALMFTGNDHAAFKAQEPLLAFDAKTIDQDFAPISLPLFQVLGERLEQLGRMPPGAWYPGCNRARFRCLISRHISQSANVTPPPGLRLPARRGASLPWR